MAPKLKVLKLTTKIFVDLQYVLRTCVCMHIYVCLYHECMLLCLCVCLSVSFAETSCYWLLPNLTTPAIEEILRAPGLYTERDDTLHGVSNCVRCNTKGCLHFS